MADIVKFPIKTNKRTVSADDIVFIGFITKDHRDIFIDKKQDIVKLLSLLKQNKIILKEADD